MLQQTRLPGAAIVVAALILGIACPVMAQSPASDLRAQYIGDLEAMQSKFNALAGAMDADMYGWQPMDGVRTVSEVFMLIVAENYVVPAAWGATPPAMAWNPAAWKRRWSGR